MNRLEPRDRAWHPRPYWSEYKSSIYRSPKHPPLSLMTSLAEETGPVFGHSVIGPDDNDLRVNFAAPGQTAIGPRISVHGRVLDQNGRPQTGILLEAWQANAGGRYRHVKEKYVAPLDPNFGGCGRTLTDDQGHYHFHTIQPGPYPWPNRENDWRPGHIHISVMGRAWGQRLITQLYFEGDPLIWNCPIVETIPSREAIETLVASLDMAASVPMDCLAYRFDIILRGRNGTWFEGDT